jgi:hypothetical protein
MPFDGRDVTAVPTNYGKKSNRIDVKEKFIAGAAGLDRKSLNNLLATRDGVKIQGFGIPGFS